jgi:hypothetical protein
MKSLALLVTLLSTAATYSQTETPATASSPVARVYVTRPTHLDGFDVSASGVMTAVPGSPFSGIDLFHLSVSDGKYLIGESDDHAHIITYAIESNGAVKEVASIDAQGLSSEGDCCYAPQTLDASGTTLYTIIDGANYYLDNFKIESNGELSYIGSPYYFGGGENVGPGLLSMLGNNKFAYATSCNTDNYPPFSNTIGFKRESSGLLQDLGSNLKFQLPKPKSGDIYCANYLATDPSDHLVVSMELFTDDGAEDGPVVLASYTADSEGNLTTKSTTATMPQTNSGIYMSISPSGKLLASDDGNGFRVYHFNGADPIAPFTGILHSSERFIEFGWDKSNHLFALSQTALHIYSATPTSINEESGSPISIPEASSVIVQSLN